MEDEDIVNLDTLTIGEKERGSCQEMSLSREKSEESSTSRRMISITTTERKRDATQHLLVQAFKRVRRNVKETNRYPDGVTKLDDDDDTRYLLLICHTFR